MTFDKNKVYTALNADEVKVGSKGFFGDSISHLKNNMRDEKIHTIKKIWEENNISRFQSEDVGDYILFYLVEEPKKETYRPYENTDEMIEDFKERAKAYGANFYKCPMFNPTIWVKDKKNNTKYLISVFYKIGVYLSGIDVCNFKFLFEKFTYLDGSPCGKKIE